MAIKKEDNVLDPNAKARWGYASGADGQIQVGPQTVEETGGVNTIRMNADDSGARNNGGGTDEATTTAEASSESLTKDQIKAQLDAKGVEYSSTATKAELLALLNQE
ncbi:hypothetical protein IQ22_02813 [Pseudomonas duriflava]|uniref:HeH/LEM domain-containing protein n=1 Tax=Pseudomonas duriflava TaxID=459528 RepID=A0A562Q8D8_9PSED|nr:hypothetical protein [Pseudomonas duriflava]TWI52978.1 hypothetical protein IQ22_02813 [Pseudomonas duriflava]